VRWSAWVDCCDFSGAETHDESHRVATTWHVSGYVCTVVLARITVLAQATFTINVPHPIPSSNEVTLIPLFCFVLQLPWTGTLSTSRDICGVYYASLVAVR
jgi:hypothetical protein